MPLRQLRRRTVPFALAVATALCASACGRRPPAGDRPVPVPPPRSVDVQLQPGIGSLAAVIGGELVLSTAPGQVAFITDRRASNPAWSPDGAWVAYLAGAPAPDRLRAVDAGGKQRPVGWPQFQTPLFPEDFAWSPREPVLAVAGRDPERQGLWLARPDGTATLIAARDTFVDSFAWSPDGALLAYSVTVPHGQPWERGAALFTVPLAAGPPRKVLEIPQGGIRLAGWWPDGNGVTYWETPNSASLTADGVPLRSLPLRPEPGRPLDLITMLIYREWLSWGPDGHTLVAVAGAGREAYRTKRLVVVDAARGLVTPLPLPARTVQLDPAWSPAGGRIAFVQAGELESSGGTALQGWAESRTLWVIPPDGSRAVQVKQAGGGIYGPQWVDRGRRLLYVRDRALWLIDLDGGAPVLVARPLGGADASSAIGYYGHISPRSLYSVR